MPLGEGEGKCPTFPELVVLNEGVGEGRGPSGAGSGVALYSALMGAADLEYGCDCCCWAGNELTGCELGGLTAELDGAGVLPYVGLSSRQS